MERLTDSMHEIAKKTKHETVSMKIVTLVTMFFLPGTFVAVRFPLNYKAIANEGLCFDKDYNEY